MTPTIQAAVAQLLVTIRVIPQAQAPTANIPSPATYVLAPQDPPPPPIPTFKPPPPPIIPPPKVILPPMDLERVMSPRE